MYHGFRQQSRSKPVLQQITSRDQNEIYAYYFDSARRELLSVEAYPLSLLLTCHKVKSCAETGGERLRTTGLRNSYLALDRGVKVPGLGD